ncbi:restriction endonuclease subunit S [Staphylococcus simulans]|uniref:restriction endonuclease subunit S n=1 Tax=Staphylococcus simulans TaxID=1286 RepID=UPI000D035B05|nr:restriction endonuclease subunit S [Staphylococcus simulans]
MHNTQTKKNIPELRFPEFEGEWEEKKLGDMAEIVRGASPRPIKDKKWFDNNSNIGWLRISDVTAQNGRIKHLEQRLSALGEQKTRVLYSQHLLLSIAATVGKPVINYVNTGVHDGFLIFMNPEFDIEYLYQWLENFRGKWKKYGQPGSQVNLNSDIVKNQKIWIGSLSEQQKIGAFFSKLDQQIELAEKKVSLLQEQKKGYMQKIFSQQLRFKDENGNDYPEWEEKKLGEVFIFFNNQRKPIKESIRTKGKYPYYGATGVIDFVDNYIFEGEYILIGEDGANILSRSAPLVYLTTGKFWVNNHAHILLPKTGNIYYFYSLLEEIDYSKYNTGTAQPKLNIQNLKHILLLLTTDIGEQQKIGAFFSKLDQRIELASQKVEQLKEQKRGLLQKMFV